MLIMVILVIGFAFAPHVAQVGANHSASQFTHEGIEFVQEFSQPSLAKSDQYSVATVDGVNSFIAEPGAPQLPISTKIFEFSPGTQITDIHVTSSEVKTTHVSKKIKPVPPLRQVSSKGAVPEETLNLEIYSSSKPYPPVWCHYTKGMGINKDGEHVLYLSLHLYPMRYAPAKDTLEYVEKMRISISYRKPVATHGVLNTYYDLVIITPDSFSDYLPPLVTHKNNHGVRTTLITLDDIYDNFSGRDHPEQIKYFLKHAFDEWGIQYVLLIGDITELPIRATKAYPWEGWGDNVLSDLYYADIYDENYSFCTWDANNNSVFGEVEYNFSGGHYFPPDMINHDGVDLYPDVMVGRLPCTCVEEAQTIVDKIITYEETTYDQIWFKKIILAGGDTFPPAKKAPPFVYEGEITNIKVAQQLPDFEHIKLWSSKWNLNAFTFNRAINRGAGFLSYAGHGFEHGWGTYRPNALLDSRLIMYYMPFVHLLRNGNKLPIIFFDACLTAKLDFNISDLDRYYPGMMQLVLAFTKLPYDTSYFFPCFAWSFLPQENGGAIATIGATRPAYTLVDEDGVYAGAGYLDVHFFKAYNKGVTVSQMFTQAQNDYLNSIGRDYFTLEEFILLGDPSLRVGGFP